MGEKSPDRAGQELVRALSHPIRVGILETLRERAASASEISEQLGYSSGVVSYHAHTLVSCGCLEVLEIEPRDGVVEKRLGITPGSFAGWRKWQGTGDEIRCDVTEATMRALMSRASKVIGLAATEAARRRARRGNGPVEE